MSLDVALYGHWICPFSTRVEFALHQRGIDHEWRLIKDGRHAWGRGFQHQALPPSFAMIGAAMRAGLAKKAGLDSLGGKRDGKGPRREGGAGDRR